MSYQEVADVVIGKIREISGFGEENTSIGDWNVLNDGGGQWAILEYIGFQNSPFTTANQTITWNINILLILEEITNTQVSERSAILREAILAKFAEDPQLGSPSVIFDSLITDGARLPPDETISVYMETITCQIQEIRS